MSDTDDQVGGFEERASGPGDQTSFAALRIIQDPQPRIEALNNQNHSGRGRLPITTADGMLYLPFESVLHLRADGCYTHVFVESKQYLTCIGLGELERALPSEIFHRCHHAHVINLLKVS